MAAEDVAQALMALENPTVRRMVAGGTVGALGKLALTPDERRLVRDATPTLPIGDRAKVLVRVRAKSGYWPPGAARAIQYVQARLTDPRIQARFIAWQESVMDKFP